MYCPRCSSQVIEDQRFCRTCGLKLDVILDAMENRPRGPLDFETLKRDLRDLGASLRAGFEEAGATFKKTQKLGKNLVPPDPQAPSLSMPNWSREFEKALKRVKAAHSRKYSLQQATLSIFGGAAFMYVWDYLLNRAADSGLLQNIELIILEKTGTPVVGLASVLMLIPLFGLIPMARGIAHLINGIFFVPKAVKESDKQSYPAPGFVYSSPAFSPPPQPTSTESKSDANAHPNSSVTEEETLRFEGR